MWGAGYLVGQGLKGRLAQKRKRLQFLSSLAGRLSIGGTVCLLLALLSIAQFSSKESSIHPERLGAFTSFTSFTPTGSLSQTCLFAFLALNPVAAENTCPGSSGWRVDHAMGAQNAIMGFTVPESVDAGSEIRLYVSTLAPTYTFSIYRMGWYQGAGGRLMYSSPVIHGIDQPQPTIDPTMRTVSCDNWRDPLTIQVPQTWVSGAYVVKFVSSYGFMRYTPFVVRNDASRSQILMAIPFMTYQAYNLFGGLSLYYGPDASGKVTSTGRSLAVSFDRPYLLNDGLEDFPRWDYDIIRWFEREGYNVSYTTDVQLQEHGGLLLNHRLIVISGHAEYWSTEMRNAVTVARANGVSLAFLGGNDMWWHVRFQSSQLAADRVVVCYRYAQLDPLAKLDPSQATVRWSAPPINDPPGLILGGQYAGLHGGKSLALTFQQDAAPLLAGTGLAPGSQASGLIGGEGDAAFAPASGSLPSQIQILSSASVPGDPTGHVWNMTLYTAPSGAGVFDAGTLQFAWGLDNESWMTPAHNYSSASFQRFTKNLLATLLAGAGAHASQYQSFSTQPISRKPTAIPPIHGIPDVP
jgi:hypothetical protein